MGTSNDGDKRRRVTIRTVAAQAGVSVPTVSKVIRQAYGVSPQLREKVQAAVTALGYRPNVAARGLRGQTFTIGMLVGGLNPSVPLMVEGIAKALAGTEYVLLIGVETGERDTDAAVNAMIDRQMDGIVLIGERESTIQRLAERMPTVVIARHDPTATAFDTVNNDDALGAGLVVDHLLDQGYRRIVMLTGDPKRVTAKDVSAVRQRGFEQALARRGISNGAITPATEDDLRDLTALIRRLEDCPDPPDAIFGWADYCALEILSAARHLGYRVPEDIGIIGYDNAPATAFTQNDLSTVDQHGEEIGRRAIALLLERISGRTEARHVMVAPSLVPRRSTRRSGPAVS